MKKRSLLNIIINTFGIVLILGGSLILLNEYRINQAEKEAMEEQREAILNDIFDVDSDTPEKPSNPGGEKPGEGPKPKPDVNVWGLIEIDDIKLSLPVIVSDDFSLMRQYLIAYKNSKLPPEKGNVAIAGHRGSCALCGFTKLKDLSEGATIRIVTREVTHTYKVEKLFIVDKTETWVLDDVKDQASLTLITCVTRSSDPRRQILRATLVESKPN